MMNKFFLLILILTCFQYSKAQVGINTSNPQGKFHVDGGKNNSATGTPTSSQQNDDMVILSDGKVGIGTIAPSVRLDVRSANSSNSVIAIGYTNQSAAAAGSGAVRYNNTSGGLIQVSDGVQWGNLHANPTKSFITAHIVANNGTKTFNSVPADVTDWQTIKDTNSDFVASTGVFTARRDGVYNINFTYDFVDGSVVAGSNVEAQIVKDGTNILIKCLKTFGKSTRNAQAGGICNGSVSLLQGETLKVRLLQTIVSGSRGLRSTTTVSNAFFGFNNLSIVEL